MRYPPIPTNDWTDAQRDVASAIVSGPRGELRGPFVPLLHAPLLAAKVQELGEVIRFKTDIPDALLEIGVLLVARAHNCANIWESHSALARKAGVAPAIIAAIAQRERPTDMSDDEKLIHRFCSELLENNKVRETTFDAAAARWGRKGVMEIAGICGYYGMLATILNVAERPLVDSSSVPFGA